MYYSKGNYEAFAHPLKPVDADKKSAYIIGTGLAALSAAFFLVRDGQVQGDRIHVFEKLPLPGGACDGYQYPGLGYTMRGGREMDDHFEVMWDVFRDVPSIEDENVSVLDYYYWLNKRDPNYSNCRVTINRGEDAHTDKKFNLSEEAQKEILELYLTDEKELEDKTIEEVFSDEVLNSNFWLYWRTMFAFENWHSALEMKRYMQRFVHHIDGLPDLSALRFTKYNQYESMILPLIHYLEKKGVHFIYNTKVDDIRFSIEDNRKVATAITYTQNGKTYTQDLTEDDLVFITNGGCVENAQFGSQNKPAPYLPELHRGGGWDMWKNIAAQCDEFGHPEVFCSDPEKTNWESATVTTLDDRIPPYIEKITKRDPFAGKVVTGGIVTAKDSNWLLSWTFNRQPQFRDQPKDQLVGWIYGLFTDVEGNYVKKPMKDCTGKEICEEWLYHIGVPEDQIEEMAEKSANTVPCMMPYITAFFMPRKKEDRPLVVPNGAKNFAFIGQFAETPRDTIFTTEYSMRTAMEAVYTLMDIDRGVPEVWGSAFDVREMMKAAKSMRDGKPLDADLGVFKKFFLEKLLKKAEGTDIEKMVNEYQLFSEGPKE